MPMPHEAQGWKVSAARGDKAVTLQCRTGNEALGDPHFFSEGEFIQYDAPQGISDERCAREPASCRWRTIRRCRSV